jgi:hypothetical protein
MSTSDTNEKAQHQTKPHGQPGVSDSIEVEHMHNVVERYFTRSNDVIHCQYRALCRRAWERSRRDLPNIWQASHQKLRVGQIWCFEQCKAAEPSRTSAGRTASMPFPIVMDIADKKVRLVIIDVMQFDHYRKDCSDTGEDLEMIKEDWGNFINRFLPGRGDYDQAALVAGVDAAVHRQH